LQFDFFSVRQSTVSISSGRYFVQYFIFEKRIEIIGGDTDEYFVVNRDRNAFAVTFSRAEASGKGDFVFESPLRNRILKKTAPSL